MSALPNNFPRRVEYDFTMFVPIAMAARLVGENADALGRKCHGKLQFTGGAIFTTPPEGGQEKWFIHRSYDSKLRNTNEIARLTEPDLSAYNEKQRKVALAKRCCVERFRFARVHARGDWKIIIQGVKDELKKQFSFLKISRSSLFRWDSIYQNPCDLITLIDHRGGDHAHNASAEAWEFFRNLYLHENQPKKRYCWKLTQHEAEAQGWAWCSYAACCRQINDRIPPQEQTYHRTPARFRTTLEPFIEQDVEAWEAGENYVGDHKTLDVLCRFGESIIRPTLTAWMDWRTRKICGWALSNQPNSHTILAALRHALLDPSNMGGPSHIHIDNGKDWASWLFHGQTKSQRREKRDIRVDEGGAHGILNALGIKAHFSIPFGPNGKARLERWFGTINSFTQSFESYTGSNIESKPERLAEIVKQPHRLPTFEQVNSALREHIAGLNANADHQMDDLVEDGVRLSPAEAFRRWVPVRRVMADPKALDLLLAHWHKPVTVGRNGIKINLGGALIGYGQFAPELARFKASKKKDRKPVNVAYDPHDLNSIAVYDENWSLIHEKIEMNHVGGAHGTKISQKNVADAMRSRTAYKRAIREVADPKNSITKFLTPEQIVAMNANEEKEKNIAAARLDQPSLKIIRTPLDGVAKEMERNQLRTAVGAESMTPNRPAVPSLMDRLRGKITPRRRDDGAADLLDKWKGKNSDW